MEDMYWVVLIRIKLGRFWRGFEMRKWMIFVGKGGGGRN